MKSRTTAMDGGGNIIVLPEDARVAQCEINQTNKARSHYWESKLPRIHLQMNWNQIFPRSLVLHVRMPSISISF